jgi:hypothetical protein
VQQRVEEKRLREEGGLWWGVFNTLLEKLALKSASSSLPSSNYYM